MHVTKCNACFTRKASSNSLHVKAFCRVAAGLPAVPTAWPCGFRDPKGNRNVAILQTFVSQTLNVLVFSTSTQDPYVCVAFVAPRFSWPPQMQGLVEHRPSRWLSGSHVNLFDFHHSPCDQKPSHIGLHDYQHRLRIIQVHAKGSHGTRNPTIAEQVSGHTSLEPTWRKA